MVVGTSFCDRHLFQLMKCESTWTDCATICPYHFALWMECSNPIFLSQNSVLSVYMSFEHAKNSKPALELKIFVSFLFSHFLLERWLFSSPSFYLLCRLVPRFACWKPMWIYYLILHQILAPSFARYVLLWCNLCFVHSYVGSFMSSIIIAVMMLPICHQHIQE